MTINICIPSYKRCGKVTTFDSLPPSYNKNIFLYVRREEYDDYLKAYSTLCAVVPLDNVFNIGMTRQAIINHQYPNKILMIDDDVSIHEHYIDTLGWLRPQKTVIDENQFYTLLTTIEELMLKGAAHGGLRPSVYSLNSMKGHKSYRPSQLPFLVNAYTFTNTWYDLSVIPKELFIFDKWVMFEDLAMWAQLVSRGYDSAKLGTFLTTSVFDGNHGGCWDTRTIHTINEQATSLHEMFPTYIYFKDAKGTLPTICNSSQQRLVPTPKKLNIKKHRTKMQSMYKYYTPLIDPNRG